MFNPRLIQLILGLIIFIVLLFFGVFFAKKPGQAGEENTLKLIRSFLKHNNYQKADYLLVNNLIIKKEGFWSCEIDLLLLTRKWIYVIEVKDWKRGRLSGNLNQEYLEWSYKVGKQRRHERHSMYSPFYQNETHVKRLKTYFQLANNQNILNIVCFNSPYLEISLKESAKSVFATKPLWVSNGYQKDITDLLSHCESKPTKLLGFEELREKLARESLMSSPNKAQKHRAWAKSVRAGKGYN